MPREPRIATEAHRELEDADISFANGLVDQGLIPKASMNRVLKVISASDRDTLVDSPNDRSKRIDSASSQSKKIDLQSLPRTWKEADKMASMRASLKPKTRKSPPRSGPKVSNGTKLGSDAEAKPSRKKKSLYATSRGPKRDARSTSPSTRPQRGKAVSTNNLALRDAVLRGDSSYVRTLLRGGDCDIESYDRATGASLLHICAHEGLFEVADILIAHGANVNHANKNHESPLHWAASGDSAKIAQLLLDFGADMDALDDSGSTALMRAAAAGSPNVLAVLLSRGGDVNTPDYDGFNSVDLMEHCLSEEPRPESDAALEEGALAASMLMLRHITSRREDGRGGVSHQDEEEEEKAEQKRLQVTQRLQRAIEGRITARRSLSAATNEVASGDPPPSGPLPGVALSKEESFRDEFQAAITETAFMIDTTGAFPGKEQAVRDQFQAAVSQSFQAVQAAVDSLSLRLERKDEGEVDQDGKVEPATNSTPEQTPAQAPAPAPAVTTKPSRGVKGGGKVTLSGGTRKDARTRLLGAANKRGTAFKLGASAVSPLRRRVVVKYAPAQFLPFLPGADSARPGDVIVAVEQCADCENHGWNLRHDSRRYTNMADRCLIAVVRGVLEKRLPVRVFALKDVPKRGRLGALEVTVAVRNASGAAKPWTTHTVFSKLDSSSWPSAKKVATKARAFVRWALKEGGVSPKEEPRAAPESLSDILEEEEEKERAEKGRAGGAEGSSGPGPEGAREDACVDWESRLVGMEKQFMAWLMRLSAKGEKGEAPAIAAPPVLDLLGTGAAMSTPLEMCRRQVAQKGAFVPAFMEVALGVGGEELTSAQFDALVLEHFFVFSGVDDADPASFEAPDRAAVSRDAPAQEDGASASSAAPQPCLDEGMGASAQPLTIDVEVVDQTRQGKASSSVLGMDSPVFDIIEKQPASHGAPAGDGSGGQGGGKEGQSGAVATAPLPPQAEDEEGEESKEPLLAVGTRVEGNYMGSGQWYKGVITAASRTGGYDIEYDDDEVELGVKAEWVREVKRLPFHVRMEQKARAAAAAAAQAEEEMGRQRREELPVDEAPLSPAHGEEGGSQEVADDPFLQLSASDGGLEKPIVEP